MTNWNADQGSREQEALDMAIALCNLADRYRADGRIADARRIESQALRILGLHLRNSEVMSEVLLSLGGSEAGAVG